MDAVQFGNRLRQARENAGLSQTEVACSLYTDQGMISRYENGSVMLKVDRAAEFAKMYGVSMDWLCGMEEHGEKVVFFHTEEQLQAMTGLDHTELWCAGFNLDDWDWGFVSDREWDGNWGKIVPDYEWWLLAKMENHCVGYEHVEHKGKHYYMQYHS